MADHHEFGTGNSYRVRASSDRTFGIVFGAIFSLLAIHNAWRAGANWPWCVAVATAILVVSWIRPSLLAPLNRLWTRLGLLLGRIVTPVVLGVIFFLGVTPIAALARIPGHQERTLMARGHALGNVGNHLGNAAHDVRRKELVGMKHAQKNLSAGSDVRGGIIRIMNEQGSGVGACRCARLPALFASFRGNSNLSSTIVQKQ